MSNSLTPGSGAEDDPQRLVLSESGRQIIETGGLRGQRGGAGWAILHGIGVRPPESDTFDIHDCMREDEILGTWQLLTSNKKVWWEGGDGYGKTTFMEEFMAYVDNVNARSPSNKKYRTIFLTAASCRSIDSITSLISDLDTQQKDSPDEQEHLIYILDSADNLWEKSDSKDNLNALTIKKNRVYKKVT